MSLLDGLIDRKTHKVIEIFLKNSDDYYHIKKVSNDSKVSLATTFRIINKLVKNDFLEVKEIGKFRLYKLKENKKNKKLKRLLL